MPEIGGPPAVTAQEEPANDDVVEELKRQILECKKLALARKREGDIESAKQALLESKRLQSRLDAAILAAKCDAGDSESLSSRPLAVPVANTASTSSSTTPSAMVNDSDGVTEPQNKPPTEPKTNNDDDDDDNNDDDGSEGGDQLLDQLDNHSDHSQDGNADGEGNSHPSRASSFSLAEMMDLEMMTEFATGGLPIPSLDEYQAKLETCKRSALSFKQQGKTKEALNQMRHMKQLQIVHRALEAIVGSAAAGVLTGQEEHDTEEDKALLRELFMDEENRTQNIDEMSGDGGTSSASLLELDDLIEMDISEIKDAMALGMELPSIEAIHQQVNEQKASALQLKQAGDLEGAKAALVKFKTWSQHVSAIEELVENARHVAGSRGGMDPDSAELVMPHDIREEDLEKLLAAAEKTPAPTTPSKPKPSAPKPKSSEELRQEAIRLRDDKKLIEAAAVLKLYKEALAREAQEAELKAQQEIIQRLQKEVETALKQQDRFYFYQRLANTENGSQQVQAWWRYADLCAKVGTLVQTKGSKAVTITTEGNADGPAPAGSLRLLPEDLTDVIRQATDPSDERVECCILDIMELHTNKAFQHTLGMKTKLPNPPDWIQVEAHVSIQLPLNEAETDKPIDLYFYSRPIERIRFWDSVSGSERNQEELGTSGIPSPESDWTRRGRVAFGSSKEINDQKKEVESSQHITLARGDSKFAKTILRRMERRKMTISLHCHSHQGPSTAQSNKLKGWFGGGRAKQDAKDAMEPLLLGKVVLETKDLLDHSCIVGEYCFHGNGKREVGGKLRLCVRTGVPFEDLLDVPNGSRAAVDTEGLDALPLYSNALRFSVTKPSNDNGDGPSSAE